MSAADAAPAAIDDVGGRRLAVAQIAMGSVVTAYGQLADNLDNPAAWGLAAFFMLLQWACRIARGRRGCSGGLGTG